MAEGLLRHLAEDRFDVASAGTHPAGLNPMAIEAMREIHIDIAHHQSKSIEAFQGEPFDYVITVCDRAQEACPIYPATTSLIHWSFDDPAAAQGTTEERRTVFRLVRDQIAAHIRRFAEQEGKAQVCRTGSRPR